MSTPTAEGLLWYADYFDVSLDYIFGRTDIPGGKLYKYEPQALKIKEEQRKESIEGQIRDCKTFAEKNDIQILGTYIDRALSAKSDNRPDFQKMIKDSGKGMFDTVLIIPKLVNLLSVMYNNIRIYLSSKQELL